MKTLHFFPLIIKASLFPSWPWTMHPHTQTINSFFFFFSSSWRLLTVSSGCSRRLRRQRIIFLLSWSGLCLLHHLLPPMGHRWTLRSISKKLRRSWKSPPLLLLLRLRPKEETFTGCFSDVPVLVKAPTPLVSLPSSAFLISLPVISYAKSFPPLVSSPLRSAYNFKFRIFLLCCQ